MCLFKLYLLLSLAFILDLFNKQNEIYQMELEFEFYSEHMNDFVVVVDSFIL